MIISFSAGRQHFGSFDVLSECDTGRAKMQKMVTPSLTRSMNFETDGHNVNVSVVYALKQKFSEESVGLCEEMGLQPISELFTTDGG